MSRRTQDGLTDFEVTWDDERASTVEVAGFHDDWSNRIPLQKKPNNGWSIHVHLAPSVQKFKFLIDGLHWKTSRKYSVDKQGNNVISMEDFVLNSMDKVSVETMESSSASTTAFNSKSLDKCIVCFFADGSEKYTPMTSHAIVTFLRTTPDVKVGLLTHTEAARDQVLSTIPPHQRSRITWKSTSPKPYFDWNPTQYKLDIQKFAEKDIESIFWADSDCIFFKDISPFLHRFVSSADKDFYLALDHVMADREFIRRWEEQRPLGMVPQACLMGFKVPVMAGFFRTWEQYWREWITPAPFSKYPDPRPHFQGSAFCIEQYAMGMALEEYRGQILLFGREVMAIEVPITATDLATIGGNLTSASLSGYSGLSGLINFSGLLNYSGAFSGLEAYTGFGAYTGLENYTGAGYYTGVGAYTGAGAYTGVGAYTGAGAYTGVGAYTGAGAYTGVGAYTGAGSFTGLGEFTGMQNFSGFGSFSGAGALSGAGTLSGAGALSGAASYSGAFSGYQLTPIAISGVPTLVFLSTHASPSNYQPGVILIDKFGDSVFHCYNQTYSLAKNWWEGQQQNQN